MDSLEIAKALFATKPAQPVGGQTTTAYGIAVSDSVNGLVRVNLGGETTSTDDDQTIEVDTTFAVFEGDEVIISLVGADGTGKSPTVIGVVGRGDQQQTEINSVVNYFWSDQYGAHVSTAERSVAGANILLDADSLDIRNGNSNSEADQTVYASFGREVTVGSRYSGSTIGNYSQVFGIDCKATADYSHAEGYQTQATGTYSHAEGALSKAYGDYSHAEGNNCTANGFGSHAEGAGAYAQSGYAHAEGHNTLAGGFYSHAEGEDTNAAGGYTHAEGKGTYASGQYSHVQGKFNVQSGPNLGLYADVIGNGTDANNCSNAYEIDWDGNAEFKGEVYVGGCTLNGETPYPVVRYNTSSKKSEYYDKGDSSWKALSGSGGGASWVSLWDNPDPSSNFSAQTVPLDLSDWTFIAIVTQYSTTSDNEAVHLIRVGGKSSMDTGSIASTMYFTKRSATVTSSGITFTTGYRNTTGTSGVNYCIPVAIYGVSAEYNLDWKTFSGAIINFTTIKAHAIQSAIVDFTPSQDFNGYDKPWAGGAGKNLVSPFRSSETTKYGLTLTPNADGSVRVHGTASNNSAVLLSMQNVSIPLAAGTYTFFHGISASANKVYAQCVSSAHVFFARTSKDTYALTSATTITRLDIGINAANGEQIDVTIYPQLEAGSTATAYAPYSNICPITGWSDIDIYREAQYDAGATPYVSVSLGGTQYKGSLDVVSGELTLTDGYIASYNGEVLPSTWISDRDEYAVGTTPTTGAEVVYELASPTTTNLTPQAITALQGPNTMWSNVGNITVVARGE